MLLQFLWFNIAEFVFYREFFYEEFQKKISRIITKQCIKQKSNTWFLFAIKLFLGFVVLLAYYNGRIAFWR